jgi:cell division septal protein FtsQ
MPKKMKISLKGNWLGWLMFLAILITFLYWLKGTLGDYICSSPNFRVKNVKVTLDNMKVLEGESAYKYLGLKEGRLIFRLDPLKLAKKVLNKHPEALKVQVYKRLPSGIEVVVKNRVPIAQIHIGQFFPMDQKGFILPFPSNFRIQGLPNIEGIDPQDVQVGKENRNEAISLAMEIINILKAQLGKGLGNFDIDVSDTENVILTLENGIKVKLGSKPFKDKLSRLKLVLKDIEEKGLKPAYIDMRFKKVILVPR